MQISLENKVAVITGGGGGIGRAIAEKLARENMKIVLIGGNNLAKLVETRQIVEQFSSCHLVPGDLSDLDFVSRAVAEAGELCGGIDVRELYTNDFARIEAELKKKIPIVKEGYGYILHSDHSIPPTVDYNTFKYFREKGLELGRYEE